MLEKMVFTSALEGKWSGFMGINELNDACVFQFNECFCYPKTRAWSGHVFLPYLGDGLGVRGKNLHESVDNQA